jgi:hypothetical protein
MESDSELAALQTEAAKIRQTLETLTLAGGLYHATLALDAAADAADRRERRVRALLADIAADDSVSAELRERARALLGSPA